MLHALSLEFIRKPQQLHNRIWNSSKKCDHLCPKLNALYGYFLLRGMIGFRAQGFGVALWDLRCMSIVQHIFLSTQSSLPNPFKVHSPKTELQCQQASLICTNSSWLEWVCRTRVWVLGCPFQGTRAANEQTTKNLRTCGVLAQLRDLSLKLVLQGCATWYRSGVSEQDCCIRLGFGTSNLKASEFGSSFLKSYSGNLACFAESLGFCNDVEKLRYNIVTISLKGQRIYAQVTSDISMDTKSCTLGHSPLQY